MDIKNIRPDPAAARPTAPVPPIRDESKPPEPAVDQNPGGEAGDSVDISEDARSRAASSVADEIPFGTIAAERMLEIRRHIQERVQGTHEMADEVMRRIIERGDLP